MDATEFDRSKIYERLQYAPQPQDYKGPIPWLVQQQVSATNGIHYVDEIGHLTEYPIPPIPIEDAGSAGQLLLDIGCGWGRWLIASARKGYIPIGMDLRLEFCETSLLALRDNGLPGYAVVGDLREPPFQDDVFRAVWSFSVIQHTHRDRLKACLRHIRRMLAPGGFAKLEFPNKDGIRNRLGPARTNARYADDYNSWCVRYYSIREYRRLFTDVFGHFGFTNHSFLGIGILPNDLRYVKRLRNRMVISLSLSLSWVADRLPLLKYLSDSVYIRVGKQHETEGGMKKDRIRRFLESHAADPMDNLNIVPLLQCPICQGGLELTEDRRHLVSAKAGVKYPVVNGVPIMIRSEAMPL